MDNSKSSITVEGEILESREGSPENSKSVISIYSNSPSLSPNDVQNDPLNSIDDELLVRVGSETLIRTDSESLNRTNDSLIQTDSDSFNRTDCDSLNHTSGTDVESLDQKVSLFTKFVVVK